MTYQPDPLNGNGENDPKGIPENQEPEVVDESIFLVPEVEEPADIERSTERSLQVPDVREGQVEEIVRAHRVREWTRVWLALVLLVLFSITLSVVLAVASLGTERQWSQLKDALQIILPVETSLLGSAVVFYFTGGRERR